MATGTLPCQPAAAEVIASMFATALSSVDSSSEMSSNSLWQGSWVVMSYRSGDEMLTPDDRAAAGLTIEGSLVSGSMGVNRFSGQIGDGFPLGPLATTRMAGPPGLMVQEDTILEHLQEADTIEVIEEGMTLSRDGLLLIELERAESDQSVFPS